MEKQMELTKENVKAAIVKNDGYNISTCSLCDAELTYLFDNKDNFYFGSNCVCGNYIVSPVLRNFDDFFDSQIRYSRNQELLQEFVDRVLGAEAND